MAEFYLSEPFLFHKKLLTPPHKQAFLRDFHSRGLDWACRGKRKKLILWPRGHLKSTIFTQGETCRHAIATPDSRTLINGATHDLARNFLTAIRGYLQDPRITDLYGHIVPNSKSPKIFKNNDTELTLLTRRDLSIKEPTITVGSLDKTKTSQHYDRIIHDDLVTRENIGSIEMMDKVWRLWQDSLDLLEPGGEMWTIGTRWGPHELYGRIMSDYCDARCVETLRESGFMVHRQGCSCDFDVTLLELKDKHGNFIFDSKFNEDIAQELLRQKGRQEFALQYLNCPTDDSNVRFKHDFVTRALLAPEEINKRRGSLVWYMAVDPAESLEARSSLTAAVGVGVDHSTGIWYVDYAKGARVDTAGFVDLIFSARRQVNPSRFGMEMTTRKALEYVLKDKMASQGDFFTIEPLQPQLGRTPNAKRIRIERLVPMFEFGRIFVNSELKDLIDALYTFPSSSSWDLLDALSYVMDMVPKGLGSSVKPEPPKIFTQNGSYSYAVRRAKSGIRSRFRTRSILPAARAFPR